MMTWALDTLTEKTFYAENPLVRVFMSSEYDVERTGKDIRIN
jgi:hypothetical protein